MKRSYVNALAQSHFKSIVNLGDAQDFAQAIERGVLFKYLTLPLTLIPVALVVIAVLASVLVRNAKDIKAYQTKIMLQQAELQIVRAVQDPYEMCPAWLFDTNMAAARTRICQGRKK